MSNRGYNVYGRGIHRRDDGGGGGKRRKLPTPGRVMNIVLYNCALCTANRSKNRLKTRDGEQSSIQVGINVTSKTVILRVRSGIGYSFSFRSVNLVYSPNRPTTMFVHENVCVRIFMNGQNCSLLQNTICPLLKIAIMV